MSTPPEMCTDISSSVTSLSSDVIDISEEDQSTTSTTTSHGHSGTYVPCPIRLTVMSFLR